MRTIKKLLVAVLMLLPLSVMSQASLSIGNFNINAGETKEMLIYLSNPNDEITLVQFDLRLPSGLSLKQTSGEYDIDIAGRTNWRNHSLNANATDGIIRFLLASQNNVVISGTSGAIIKMTLTASSSFNGGIIRLENILLVTPNEKEIKPSDVVFELKGTSSTSQTSLSIGSFNINGGETKDISISLNNPDDEITLVQFDLRLPSGLSLKQTSGEYDIDIAGRTNWRNHSLNANATDGIIRFLLASQNNVVISGTSGAIIKMTLTASSSFNGGVIRLENILLVTPNEKEIKPADVVFEVKGTSPSEKLTLSANPSGGSVDSGTKVYLTASANGSTVSGANIYYTLNGSTPSTSSTKYTSSGISITKDCTLKAIAYKEGYETSNVLTASYTVKSTSPSSIAINATNFPDEYFRNYLLSQDYGKDGVLTEKEIKEVTTINVSGSKDAKGNIKSLKGIEYFTALTELYCNRNQLTSLDVSKNTALTSLYCHNNQLTSLDVSNNTALEELECSHNNITSLDVSKNTALTKLYCDYNQLTSLDVSKNTALTELCCSYNQLTSLDVSKNTVLRTLRCSNNNINGSAMDALVNSLNNLEGWKFFIVIDWDYEDGNVCTKSQVAIAKGKGWDVLDFTWGDYEGSDDEPTSQFIAATSSAGYATFFSSESAYTLPNGLSAQVVTGASNSKLTYKTIADGSVAGVVPKGTAVMLVSDNKRSGTYTLTSSTSTTTYSGTNLLRGSNEATTTTGDGYHYKLSYGQSGSNLKDVFGWYWGAQNGEAFHIEGHKAWLVVPKSTASTRGYIVDGETTGIETMDSDNGEAVYYDLQGRRISRPTSKGVYIKNGKKITIK